MKNIFLSLLICIATVYAKAENAENERISFMISGEIQGLVPGDTLVFERIILPEFNMEAAFHVIVEQPDKFVCRNSHEHIEFYLITYKPVSGKVQESNRRGITLLVEGGEIHLTGIADEIYYCQLKGGIYDNELLQEALQLENSLGKERAGLLQLSQKASTAGDTIKAKEYSNRFNSFHSDRQEDFKKLSQLETEFQENFPSSEYTVVDVLQSIRSAPFETSQSEYEKMNDEAKESYFGKILKQELDKIEALLPGKDAPDFHLLTIAGNKISLKDFAGFYVLIYHWGLCPGSIMIDNEVTELYNTYKDHLKIVGVTDDIQMIKSLRDTVKPGDKLMDTELKPVLENMLIHPWFDVEKKGDNAQIERDYAFGGFPYFVFISPERKIIARGYHKAFYTAKQTLKDKF